MNSCLSLDADSNTFQFPLYYSYYFGFDVADSIQKDTYTILLLILNESESQTKSVDINNRCEFLLVMSQNHLAEGI